MINVAGSNRHPLGQLAYRIISGNTWYDALVVIEDQKVSDLPLVYFFSATHLLMMTRLAIISIYPLEPLLVPKSSPT